MSGQMTGNEALALWMKQQTDSAQLAQQEQQHTQHLLDSLAAQHSHQPTATTTMYAAFPTGQPLYSTTSSASQAIPFPSHLVQHDNNSYEDSFPLVDNYSYGTPSYAGSWTGSSSYTSDSFAPPPPAPADAFLASYGHQPPQQHQQQHGFAMGDHYNPFLSYRDPAMGSAHGVDEEAGSAYGGSSVAGGASSTAGSAIGAADDLGGMIDFDFEPMVIGEGGSSSSAPPSPFAGSEGAEMQVEGGQGGRYRMGAGGTFISPSQQQRDVGTPGSDRESSAALPLVFTSTLSESPPASSADFPTAAARTTSPPLLAPLAIPSDGPSFNLIPPSAATARPRDPPKGADTLELESILGMGEWPTKQQNSSFSDFTPHPPSSSSAAAPTTNSSEPPPPTDAPRPLLSSAFSSPPESFDSTQPSPSSRAAAGPPPIPGDSLAVPRPPVARRRSRSEADIRSHQQRQQQQQVAPQSPAPAPPPPLAALHLQPGYQFLADPIQQQQFLDLSNHPPPPPHQSHAYSPSASSSIAPQPLQIDPITWNLMSTQHQQQQYQPHMSFAPPPPPGSLEATLSSSAHSHATHAYSPAAGGGVAGDDMAEQIRMHQQLMQQHELALTARNGRASFGSQGTRARGGPGYHEAGGMFGEVGDGSHIGGGGHRRSRSHGHVRGVKSEDLGGSAAGFMFGADASGGKISPSEVYGGGGGFFEGMLAPPHLQRSPSIPPSAHSHPSRSPSPSGSVHSLHSHASQHSLSAAASGVPGYNPHHPSPSPSNPLYYASSTAASNADSASPFQHRPFVPSHPHLGPQSTPFVYHSPVASPAPSAGVGEGGEGLSEYFVRGRQGSGGSVGSVGSGSGPVTTQSKTTPATIEAAMRRRNPGTEAKFVCDLCGETFTRRYNLKGHQRAHRNEKPFACSYEGCGKAFARAHDCKRHELLHQNVRRYHCEPCRRDFVRLDALQRHHRSELGQTCVEQLRAQGYEIPYDTAVVESTAGTGEKAQGGVQL